MKKNNIIFIGLILLSGLIRLIPHPWNFTPLLAACIFSGSKIKPKGLGIFVPLLAIFLGDMFIGFYSGMVWVYAGYILTISISVYLRKSNTLNSKLLNVPNNFFSLNESMSVPASYCMCSMPFGPGPLGEI